MALQAQVIINEIHFKPTRETDHSEFVELHNAGSTPVDLSGWKFSKGIQFTFPAGSSLKPGAFLVLAQETNGFKRLFQSAPFATFQGRLSNGGEVLELSDDLGQVMDTVDYQLGFPWPTVGDGAGSSIELIHPGLSNQVGGNWRPSNPGGAGRRLATPGATNSAWTLNFPPVIRQVRHTPVQPRTTEPVTISARLTHPVGIRDAVLFYQVVAPGDYLEMKDPRYKTKWEQVPLRNDGENGDEKKGDEIFSGVLPGNLQKHRHLVRYRIEASGSNNVKVRAPYPDDPQPNFAYFVYDGIPSWRGAIEPRSRDPERARVVEFSSASLNRNPVYHLLSRKSSVEDSNWREQHRGDDYKWSGTLIYDGEVYDHIHFRARGGSWRYAMGKQMWKFDFNRGHDFQARDNYGKKYREKWTKLNLGACIQQVDYGHRGEQGLFESVGFRLFNLAGVEGPNTHFVHFRVVDEAAEYRSQYEGDFWGLYLAVEDMDGRFLDEHGLPDGNLYKMEGGTGEVKNLGFRGPGDGSDLSGFMTRYQRQPPEIWWRDNFDLPRYYSYRSIVECIHHYDIDKYAAKNYFYFRNPTTDRWSVHPWDIDLSWSDSMYGGGEDTFKQPVLSNPTFRQEYQVRLQEIRDLLYNTNQAWQLIEDYAALVDQPGPSLVKADRALWDYHPVMAMPQHIKGGQGRFYEATPARNFSGMVQVMKNYVVRRSAWIDQALLRDQKFPPPSAVRATGSNHFQATLDSSKVAAVQWRAGAVEDSESLKEQGKRPGRYEIVPVWTSGELKVENGAAVRIPATSLQSNVTYRVRARVQDAKGLWSRWSAPVEARK